MLVQTEAQHTPNALPTRQAFTQGGVTTGKAPADCSTLGEASGKEENVCIPSALPATQNNGGSRVSVWKRLQHFVQRFIPTHAKSEVTETSLMTAIQSQDINAAEALLSSRDAQKMLRERGVFLLTEAVKTKDYQMFRLLYEKGANKAKDRDNVSALWQASRDDLSMAEVVLEAGFVPNVSEEDRGESALLLSCLSGNTGFIDLWNAGTSNRLEVLAAAFRVTAAHGSLGNMMDIHKAIGFVYGKETGVVNFTNPYGETALLLASRKCQPLALFVSCFVDINHFHSLCFDRLVNMGADHAIQNDRGETAQLLATGFSQRRQLNDRESGYLLRSNVQDSNNTANTSYSDNARRQLLRPGTGNPPYNSGHLVRTTADGS